MECIGFNLHVRQHGDFIVRNPIYYMLVNNELPLYSAREEYFVYYHAFWLPPAYFSRLFPTVNHPEHLWYGSFWAGRTPNSFIFEVKKGTKVYISNSDKIND